MAVRGGTGIYMGEIIKAEINEMNLLGNGITKQDGCVVFCLGAVDGDSVTAEITQVRKNFKIAEIRSMDKESEFRCEADCSVYGECGGCVFRHITYAHELEVKKSSVENALRRGGVGQVKVDRIISADAEGYRNKIVLHFAENGILGYMNEGTHKIVPVSSCKLCPSKFLEIASFAADYFADKAKSLTYFYIRGNHDNSEMTVVIGCKKGEDVELTEFADCLFGKYPEIVGVMRGEGNHPEENNDFKIIRGDNFVASLFCGLEVKVSAASFFQVNYKAAELLAETVADFASPENGEYGADLYCGTGILGLACAAKYSGAFITGVEINEKAVADAKENAQNNGLFNIGYYGGDSADFVKGAYGAIDFAIIDPPRAGCSDKMIKELVRLKPKRIVAVSCSPDTLGRDLKKLTDSGYSIEKVVVCDLFPRTKHVETVCLLLKK